VVVAAAAGRRRGGRQRLTARARRQCGRRHVRRTAFPLIEVGVHGPVDAAVLQPVPCLAQVVALGQG